MPDPMPADPRTPHPLDAQALDIARELRCLVCQNESIAESRSDLARDLRATVRDLLHAGASRDDVLRHMTERYGDFVRYQPPLTPRTALLWAGPALFVAGGALALGWTLRRRARLAADRFEDDPGPDSGLATESEAGPDTVFAPPQPDGPPKPRRATAWPMALSRRTLP
jgi:cytochrome c-type biogenesis protein CcmH